MVAGSIAASADLRVAIRRALADTGLPAVNQANRPPRMTRTPSKLKAAMWMACWLSLMLVLTVAGREAMRELNVFQLMEMRSVLGLLMLCPLISAQGGFAVVKTARF